MLSIILRFYTNSQKILVLAGLFLFLNQTKESGQDTPKKEDTENEDGDDDYNDEYIDENSLNQSLASREVRYVSHATPLNNNQSTKEELTERTDTIVTEKSLEDKLTCKLLCIDPEIFPILLEKGRPKQADKDKFIKHLKKWFLLCPDVEKLMLACNDPEKGSCSKSYSFYYVILAFFALLIIMALLVWFIPCMITPRSSEDEECKSEQI